MNHPTLHVFGFVLLAGLLTLTAWADLTITRDSDGVREREYYTRNQFATFEDGQPTCIVNLVSGQVTLLHPAAKVYAQSSLEEWPRAVYRHLEAVKAQLEADPETKRRLEHFARSRHKTRASLKEGATATLGGVTLRQHVVLVDGRPSEDLWVSADLQRRIEALVDHSRLRVIEREFRRLEESVLPSSPVDRVTDTLEDTHYVVYRGGGHTPAEELPNLVRLTVTEGAIPPSVFRVPTEYRQISLQEYFQVLQQSDADDFDDGDED